jgi:hypothetical protein
VDAEAAESLLRFAERSAPQLRGLDAKVTFAELERQHAELLEGMDWFMDQGRADEGFRIATSLVPFWMATKRLRRAPPGSIEPSRRPAAATPIEGERPSTRGTWRSGRVTMSAPLRSTIGRSSSVGRRTIPP